MGSSWIKNNIQFGDQYKITTDGSGNWSGSLEIQPDILDSGYEGAGDYIFKVARYTDSGSLTWSNEVTIKLNAQAVVFDDENESDVLGTTETQSKKSTKSPEKENEEYSLEKYIKVSTNSPQATSASTPTEVKGEKKTNFLSIIGTILVIIGTVPIIYALYNKFRKRNEGAG